MACSFCMPGPFSVPLLGQLKGSYGVLEAVRNTQLICHSITSKVLQKVILPYETPYEIAPNLCWI